MNQGRNAAQAGRHEHQCSEEAILYALEPRMHCHEDGQSPENSSLLIAKRRVLDSSTRPEIRKTKLCTRRFTNHRPVDIA